MRSLITAMFLALPTPSHAADHSVTVTSVIDQHVLPGFSNLAQETKDLHAAATADCRAGSPRLTQAFNDSFDAWIRVGHLRFGPTEFDDRAFALAFWPDTKGFTPKTLTRLMTARDKAAYDRDDFRQISIAGRGFYALEFLLYDAGLSTLGDAGYRCALTRAITQDIADNAAAILADWRAGYSDTLTRPGAGRTYETAQESVQELYKSLVGGLQFTADTRLGRPLGTFDRPRPNRAEARRSGRSLRHVVLSLEAARELATMLAGDDIPLATTLGGAFDETLSQASALNDPVFAGVASPQTRLKVEILQQSITGLRNRITSSLGPHLGVSAGFNALDGD